MAAQMPHLYPRQDQEAHIVRQQRKVAFMRAAVPGDKGVAAQTTAEGFTDCLIS